EDLLGDEDRPTASATKMVAASEQVAGVWIPSEVVRQARNAGSPEYQEWVFKSLEFRVGKVSEQDIVVNFPAGSKVVDSVRKFAYLMSTNGTFELLRFTDVRTGSPYHPPLNPVVNQIDASTPSLYTSTPGTRV